MIRLCPGLIFVPGGENLTFVRRPPQLKGEHGGNWPPSVYKFQVVDYQYRVSLLEIVAMHHATAITNKYGDHTFPLNNEFAILLACVPVMQRLPQMNLGEACWWTRSSATWRAVSPI